MRHLGISKKMFDQNYYSWMELLKEI